MRNNVPEGEPYPIRYVRDEKYHYIRNLYARTSLIMRST